MVNTIFPPVICDTTTDDDDGSDANRSADEGFTSDEELQFGVLE